MSEFNSRCHLPPRSEREARAENHDLDHAIADANIRERRAAGLPTKSSKLTHAHQTIQRLCEQNGLEPIPIFTMCRISYREACDILKVAKSCVGKRNRAAWRSCRDAAISNHRGNPSNAQT